MNQWKLDRLIINVTRIKSPNKKRATVLWAEFMLATPRNKELKDMLDFIIDYCKNK